MPDMVNQTPRDNEDFNELIKEAGEQYQVYLDLNQLTLASGCGIAVETYQRDINHPLSIHVTA